MLGKALFVFSCIASVYGVYVFNVSDPDPPNPDQVALMARYVMHNTVWVSIATISSHKSTLTYPFVNLKSMSDGPVSNGTGVPYIFMTDRDISGEDLLKDRRCTIMASLAETNYCETNNLDPQDPRCARTIITGKLVVVDNTTAEYEFSKNALFSRHPSMENWPVDHGFYVTKVEIKQILVLDYFGGIKTVSVKDYFEANADHIYENIFHHKIRVVKKIPHFPTLGKVGSKN